jgi:hypothetical protein
LSTRPVRGYTSFFDILRETVETLCQRNAIASSDNATYRHYLATLASCAVERCNNRDFWKPIQTDNYPKHWTQHLEFEKHVFVAAAHTNPIALIREMADPIYEKYGTNTHSNIFNEVYVEAAK